MPDIIRSDGRSPDEARPVKITLGFLPHAEGSALIETGGTHVICAASIAAGVPGFLRGTGRGWVTAEYGMLPRSTHTRTARESRVGRQSGRSLEIQRLIGRSLRAAVDLDALGERTITIDCDVLRADGGTRTAAITGGFCALRQSLMRLTACGELETLPIISAVAAISAGVVDGVPLLDLAYDEDSRAGADFNMVMNDAGQMIEVQGSAEGAPFSLAQLEEILRMGGTGIQRLLRAQVEAFAAETAEVETTAGRASGS